jgi:hypothetical protein
MNNSHFDLETARVHLFIYGWTPAKPSRLYDPPRSDAVRADPHSHGSTLLNGSDLLKIRQPSGLGFVVGVADIVTDHRFLAADLANPCHLNLLVSTVPDPCRGEAESSLGHEG